MVATLVVDSLFSQTEKFMFGEFDGWERDLPHQGEKGGLRERRVAEFLSRILPRKYGIGTGHIVDGKGMISCQTDIVIYDAVDGIALPIDKYYSVFPVECVYAAIEVKSKLTASDGEGGPQGEIYQCIKNTRSMTDRTIFHRPEYSKRPVFFGPLFSHS